MSNLVYRHILLRAAMVLAFVVALVLFLQDQSPTALDFHKVLTSPRQHLLPHGVVAGFRQQVLEWSDRALEETGVAFLINQDGGIKSLARIADDHGFYYFVTMAKRIFDVPLDVATFGFYYGLIYTTVAIAMVFTVLSLRANTVKAIVPLVFLAASRVLIDSKEIYFAPGLALLLVIPIYLYSARCEATRRQFALLLLCGASLAFFRLLRSGSEVAPLVFITVHAIQTRFKFQYPSMQGWVRSKFVVAGLVTIGFAVPQLFLQQLYSERDEFLRNLPEYKLVSEEEGYGNSHAKWHSVYIALGYAGGSDELEPDLAPWGEIKYDDSYGWMVGYPDAPYTKGAERNVRDTVVRIALRHPTLILSNIYEKFLVIWNSHLVYFVPTVLCCTLLLRVDRALGLGYAGALAVSLLPGLLVMPRTHYLTGLTIACILLSIHCIDLAASGRLKKFVTA
jgi:hypothetical protein